MHRRVLAHPIGCAWGPIINTRRHRLVIADAIGRTRSPIIGRPDCGLISTRRHRLVTTHPLSRTRHPIISTRRHRLVIPHAIGRTRSPIIGMPRCGLITARALSRTRGRLTVCAPAIVFIQCFAQGGLGLGFQLVSLLVEFVG
ncbi:MAG TPA: hypothetical protein VFE65_00190 [Pseudonocardia sp.]|nr:hypothetical protein [Pseudonocardia sp.]